jgi:mannose-6-phosphate isomerase-like protein (cupin superfamily)
VANSHLDFFALASGKTGRNMEPFVIDINPSTEDDPIYSTHEGEEFIYVLEGSVKISYGKDSHILHKGESIYYDSIVPHLVSSGNASPAKIVAVVYSPA